ncbi:ATP-dependent Clp protease proteolytic subunit 2 [Striga asiatica]|uniref:ATP-dependent Clp protease proteolytic subunit 2 n=1 Tax=Striga asiatica TaxID=4170 RepID=A0A5A7PCE6_STRAF|nr:ATP-dependent Clp protease proteolytic subunit 2 [Striga asiatica]
MKRTFNLRQHVRPVLDEEPPRPKENLIEDANRSHALLAEDYRAPTMAGRLCSMRSSQRLKNMSAAISPCPTPIPTRRHHLRLQLSISSPFKDCSSSPHNNRPQRPRPAPAAVELPEHGKETTAEQWFRTTVRRTSKFEHGHVAMTEAANFVIIQTATGHSTVRFMEIPAATGSARVCACVCELCVLACGLCERRAMAVERLPEMAETRRSCVICVCG